MFADGVMESSLTTGLSDYILTGPVYNGLSFGQKFAHGDPVVFIVQTPERSKFEIILGSYSVGVDNRLLRTTVLSSSAAGSKINWLSSDVYYIASFASADVLRGVVSGNLQETTRPWWVTFGRWLKQNFPIAGRVTEYFYDGVNDIPLGEINTSTHAYHSVFMPAGAVMLWGGDTAPPGFILCDGTLLNRTTYAELFAAIGVTYGFTSGTSFRVPNLKGRVPVGKDPNTGGAPLTGYDIDTLGTTGGSYNTAVTFNVTGTTVPNTTAVSGTGAEIRAGGSQNTPALAHTHDIPALALNLSVTAPSAIDTVQPFLVMNYIISTGKFQ